MYKKYSLLLVVSGLTFLFAGCGGEKKDQFEVGEVTKDTLSNTTRRDLQLVRVNIPSPSDISSELAKAGVNYNQGILNSTSRASGYSSNYKAALNLGVYGADLGYAAAYSQSQSVIDYLNTVAKIAQTVGVADAFDQELIKKFEANIGKKDSLMPLIDAAYEKAEKNLRSSQRVSTTTLIVAGGWVEGLYISTQASANTPPDKASAIYKRTWSHLYAFRYVIELLNEYKNTADCAKAITELKGMQELFDTYNKKPYLTEEDMKVIREKIAAVRSLIVS